MSIRSWQWKAFRLFILILVLILDALIRSFFISRFKARLRFHLIMKLFIYFFITLPPLSSHYPSVTISSNWNRWETCLTSVGAETVWYRKRNRCCGRTRRRRNDKAVQKVFLKMYIGTQSCEMWELVKIFDLNRDLQYHSLFFLRFWPTLPLHHKPSWRLTQASWRFKVRLHEENILKLR